METDRRHIRNRIGELKRQLREVVRHRQLHRARRRKTGVYQAALVGYTNAGKSTLLKQLTAADVLVENQLFATLDPTSRSLVLPSGKEIILTDTVGFIQNLPHDLVAAFRATLEEVLEADLIIHVVDSSSPVRDGQIAVVEEVLAELGAQGKEQLTVFNKIDLLAEQDHQQEVLVVPGEFIRISAYNADDLKQLLARIQQKVSGGELYYRIPAERGDLVSQVYRLGEVLECAEEEGRMVMKVRVNRPDYEQLGFMLKEFEWEASAPI